MNVWNNKSELIRSEYQSITGTKKQHNYSCIHFPAFYAGQTSWSVVPYPSSVLQLLLIWRSPGHSGKCCPSSMSWVYPEVSSQSVMSGTPSRESAQECILLCQYGEATAPHSWICASWIYNISYRQTASRPQVRVRMKNNCAVTQLFLFDHTCGDNVVVKLCAKPQLIYMFCSFIDMYFGTVAEHCALTEAKQIVFYRNHLEHLG